MSMYPSGAASTSRHRAYTQGCIASGRCSTCVSRKKRSTRQMSASPFRIEASAHRPGRSLKLALWSCCERVRSGSGFGCKALRITQPLFGDDVRVHGLRGFAVQAIGQVLERPPLARLRRLDELVGALIQALIDGAAGSGERAVERLAPASALAGVVIALGRTCATSAA